MRSERKGDGVGLAKSFVSFWKEFGFCAQGSGEFLELGDVIFRFAFWEDHSHDHVEPPLEGGKAGGPDTG